MGVNSKMPRINFADIDRCVACKANLHRDCDHHMNDGAGDALDFVLVDCKCPCKGRITESYLLIDLVQDLSWDVEKAESRLVEEKERATRLQHALNDLAQVFTEMLDEEGQVLDLGKFRNTRSVIEAWARKLQLEDYIE